MSSSNEIHPLFNPVIIGKIFSFLQIQSLKSSRLTCKLWSHAALPLLRRTSKVVLIRGAKADRDQYSFRNFLEFVTSLPPDCIPFENYYLDHWALNVKREKSVKQFWDICGTSMKNLHLSNVIFYEVETIRNILYYWSPNVKTLKLEDCLFYTITNESAFDKIKDAVKDEEFDEPNLSYDYYDHIVVEQLKNVESNSEISCVNGSLVELSYEQLEDEEFPLAWEEIFHAFPNLKRLKIGLTTRADQTSKILEALDRVRQYVGVVGSVAELTFFRNNKPNSKLALNDSHLYKISDIICLPLTSLSFVVNDSIQLDSIINIVRQYSPVLKNLCLHKEVVTEESPSQTIKEDQAPLELFKYQKFPSLSKLCVSMSILGENFHVIDRMPQLKILSVWLREEEFSWDTPIDELIVKSKTLQYSNPEMHEVRIGYTVTSPQSISLLCSWFKNLRVLMMALTDEIIRVVFKELKNLEEITVFDRYLTDLGITGNPFNISENTAWNSKTRREFSYIGDLKKLWKFTLTFRRYESITDASVYQGLMDVPELSSLLLTRTKIGDKALKDLSMKSSLISMVTPTVCKGVDIEYAD